MLGDKFDPSGALEDKDAAGELLGVLALFMILTAAYHRHIASRGAPRASVDPHAADAKAAAAAAAALGRDENFFVEPEDANVENLMARKKQEVLERNFWNTLSPLDLRHGSHVGVISRFSLGLYRLGALCYCIAMWVIYFKDGVCCDDLQYLEPYSFALYTLYFLFATFVSIKSPQPDGSIARYEVVMVCLYEVAFPMALFLCVTYWSILDRSKTYTFPSHEKSMRRTFASLNAGLMLLEWAMNRIVLHSSRWMWVAYLCELYLFVMICIEKLAGKSYLVYRDIKFLPLELGAYPLMVEALMSAIAFYYFVCVLVSLKQYGWTSPLSHPVEGAFPLRQRSSNGHDADLDAHTEGSEENHHHHQGYLDQGTSTGARAAATAETPLLEDTDDAQRHHTDSLD